MPTMSLGKALNNGLRQAMERDPKVVLMGEDIGKLGGVFRVTEGLQRDFGDRRVIDTPLAESGVIGTAVGLAMRGYRPVCEIQFDGFVYPAFDQIVSQVAKLRYRNEGRVAVPLTIRVPFGGGVGAVEHHSESPEAYFAHTAGLRVVTPSNAADGYRMIQQAIASDDPVVFFEPKRRYWEKGEVDEDAAAVRRPAPPGRGPDARGTTSPSPPTAPWSPRPSTRRASPRRKGTSMEVIDLRSLSPVDFETIEASVRKTGRLVVAHEASVFGGLGAEIAARVSERCFYHLESPVRRVGGFATPVPALPGRAPLPPRRRPDPPRGGPVPPAMSSVRRFVLPDLGEGLTEADARGLARRGRRRRGAEPGPPRGGDREGRGRAAQPLRRHRRRTAGRRGGDGPRRGPAHRHRHPRRPRCVAPRRRCRCSWATARRSHLPAAGVATAAGTGSVSPPPPPAAACPAPGRAAGAVHGPAERGRPGRRDRPRPGRRHHARGPGRAPRRVVGARRAPSARRGHPSGASRSTWRRPWSAAWPRRRRPASSSPST